MKYLKLFESFDKENIDSICKKYGITNYTINEDGTIDVNGDVNLSRYMITNEFLPPSLKMLPLFFRNVTGNFSCDNNELTSLEGSPQVVGGNFNCSFNQLETLKGGPKSVGGDFWCSDNQLTSLVGGPQLVGSHFWCYRNKLTSLKGSPKSVGGNFNFSHNQLTSLEGSPQVVVGGIFNCNDNKLISLDGFPKSVDSGFWFYSNPCTPIYDQWFNTDREEELMDMMKDYDFLRGDTINWYLLEAFFKDAGLEVPSREELEKNYTIED
jgi:hypothetical protein